jgi:hypothetical protein
VFVRAGYVAKENRTHPQLGLCKRSTILAAKRRVGLSKHIPGLSRSQQKIRAAKKFKIPFDENFPRFLPFRAKCIAQINARRITAARTELLFLRKLPLAMSATVLLSSYVIRVKEMWRQAPFTAALVIAAGLTHHSKLSGVEIGLRRVSEVMLGCVMGLLVTWLISKIWPPQEPRKEQGATKPSSP